MKQLGKGDANLKPQSLSSTKSEEKNDPLVNSMLLVPGIAGFVERIGTRRFQLDFTQYQEVIRNTYDAQVTFDRSLKKYLPYSFFQYYAHVQLWRRLLTILAARGHHTLERDQLESLFVQETPIPEDVHLYLLGIGDIVDANARQFELALQAVPEGDIVNFGATGSFGLVDQDTHIFYETIPAPIVSLLKIQADLEYTLAAQDPAVAAEHPEWLQPDWNLPPNLAPVAPATVPTVGLLGWARRERITQDAQDALTAANFAEDDFGVRNIFNIPINVKLIEYVANMLNSSKCAVKAIPPTSRFGSLAQIPYQRRAIDDAVPEPFRVISGKRGITCSYTQANVHIACSAATFRYRIQRRSRMEQVDNLCYRFQGQPLIQWIQNENSVFTYGIGETLWNLDQFTIGEQDGHALAYSLSLRTRRDVKRD